MSSRTIAEYNARIVNGIIAEHERRLVGALGRSAGNAAGDPVAQRAARRATLLRERIRVLRSLIGDNV